MAEEGILVEIFTSPLNICLLLLCLYLLYKILRGDKPSQSEEREEQLPKMKKRDFTLAQLKEFDGLQNPRILMAINGKVFDVTRGKKFYGPGERKSHLIQGSVKSRLIYYSYLCSILHILYIHII